MRKLILFAVALMLVMAGWVAADEIVGNLGVTQFLTSKHIAVSKSDTSKAFPLGFGDTLRIFGKVTDSADAGHDSIQVKVTAQFAPSALGPWCGSDSANTALHCGRVYYLNTGGGATKYGSFAFIAPRVPYIRFITLNEHAVTVIAKMDAYFVRRVR